MTAKPAHQDHRGVALLFLALAVAVVGCTTEVEPGATPADPGLGVAAPPTHPPPTETPPTETPSTEAPPRREERVATTGRWHLDALDPGGEVLQVTATYGGCEEFIDLDIEQTTERVTLTSRLTEPAPSGVVDCPAIARAERIVVVLDAPLGDRLLEGCGEPPPTCLALDREGAWDGASMTGSVVATDGDVVIEDWERLLALDADDGALRWQRPHGDDRPQSGGPLVAVDDLVLWQAAGRRLLAFDRVTGHIRWDALIQGTPFVHRPADDAGALIVGPQPGPLSEVDPDYRRVLGALDARTGDQVWQRDLGGPRLWDVVDAGAVALLVAVDLDEEDLPVGTNRSAASTTIVTAHDVLTGNERWTRRLAGGVQQIEVLDGVAILHVWAARYGIDVATGEERWRDLPVENAGLLEAPGQMLVVEARTRRARRLDPQTGALSPSPLTVPHGTTVAGDLLVSVDAAGVATAVDATSGQERWSTPLQARVTPPARDGDLVVFGTPLGALALDARDGSLRWSFADRALEGLRTWE